jgi:hypothetical protein
MRTRRSLTTSVAIVVAGIISAAVVWHMRAPNQTHAPSVASKNLAASNAGGARDTEPFRPRPAAVRTNAPGAAVVARDSHEWVHAIVDSLTERGDPQSLSAAALLMGANALDFMNPTDPTDSREAFNRRHLDLIRRAAAAAPNDAAIQSLALNACRGVKDCDAALYENTLAAIDAANAWTATPGLRRAVAEGEATKQAEILEGMARAPRFDSYRARIEALVRNALESVDVLPSPDAHWDATPPKQRLLAQTMNMSPANDGFGEVFKACRPSAPESVQQNCRTVAKLMWNSDDDWVARSGLELARTFARPGSAEAAQLAEAQRTYDWQTYQAIRLPRSPTQNARFVGSRLGDPQLRREVLLENGVPLKPPADWVSPSEPPR